jgi:pyridoxamine 5'-phosphate oxidase
MVTAMDVRCTDDPVAALRRWWGEAQTGRDPDAAMVLATVGADGMPSARVVLCRGIEDDGSLLFFTNYRSRKGRELLEHPKACAVFYWSAFNRQVRVEGEVRQLDPDQSDAYFRRRPRESRLSAWVSPQSEPVTDLELQNNWAEVERRFAGQDVDRPPWWGGYRLRPLAIELWLHGDHRMHHRLRFEREGEHAWRSQRLAP